MIFRQGVVELLCKIGALLQNNLPQFLVKTRYILSFELNAIFLVVITSSMNESAVGFCCNTVNIFPVIISNIVTEVGRGLENRIIENNFSHKESFDKKQMKGISTTECILT